MVFELENIKHYYKPIQPAVTAGNGPVIYREMQPAREIESFVYCFWQLKTEKPLSQPFNYRVVSDGCIDIFFDHNDPKGNFVMGFCKRYTEFPIGNEFDYIGIRFLPAAFPLLFGVNARSLSNQSQELNCVAPDMAAWMSSEITPCDSFEDVTDKLNGLLMEKVEKSDFEYDSRFFSALHLIFLKNGCITAGTDLNTGLSPRHLRRVFNYHIGTTAKTFSKVVRFQHILNAEPSRQSLRENKLYFDVGFFDQAHFIRDFKTFYGVTPSEAFR